MRSKVKQIQVWNGHGDVSESELCDSDTVSFVSESCGEFETYENLSDSEF